MLNKKLLILLATALPFFASAQNGYWDVRQVCDYRTVQTNEPYTLCAYSGSLWTHHRGQYFSEWVTSSEMKNGHVACSSQMYTSRSVHYQAPAYWDAANNRYVYPPAEWIHLSGWIGLANTSHLNRTRSHTEVVPGSCREELVWIPLCEGCQIP